MILINDKQRCELCFSELQTGAGRCRFCGGISKANINAMHEGTILMGRYVTGMLIYADEICNYYAGFDPEEDSKVFIQEFFLKGTMSRKNGSAEAEISLQDAEEKAVLSTRLEDFRNSIRIMSELQKTGRVAGVCSFFNENNTAYSVIKAHGGITLDKYVMQHGGKLSEDEAVPIMNSIIRALSFIHGENIIHGNLRPENIIIDNGTAILTGLRAGSFVYNSVTGPLRISNPYAPPEQYQKNANTGAWTDIFSLGYVMSYMLSGSVPQSSLSRVLDGQQALNAGDIPGISQELRTVISRMSNIPINSRYSSLEELCYDLSDNGIINLHVKRRVHREDDAEDGKATGVHIGAVEIGGAKNKKRLIIVIAAAAAVLLILAGAIWLGFSLFSSGSDKAEEKPSEPVASEEVQQEESEDTDDAQAPSEKPDDGGNAELPAAPGGSGGTNSGGQQWFSNIMMSTENSGGSSAVLGSSKFSKDQITAIEFAGSLEGASKSAWDVSANKDKSVKAWVTGSKNNYTLHIGAEGGINAQNSAQELFMGYTSVTSIKFNGCFHTEYTTSMCRMFKNCTVLSTIDLSGIDSVLVTDMSSMFENCNSLSSITFPASFSTGKVITMAHMFDCCTALKELDISMFNTAAVKNMSCMFYKCKKLETLDISNFNMANADDLSQMFQSCSKLKSVDFGAGKVFDTANVTGMFNYCSKLTEVKTVSEVIRGAYNNKQ